jgi:hypothetical protein
MPTDCRMAMMETHIIRALAPPNFPSSSVDQSIVRISSHFRLSPFPLCIISPSHQGPREYNPRKSCNSAGVRAGPTNYRACNSPI